MSTTLNTISNTTTQNSHNNNNNNEYYTPTLPQLTKAVEYAEEQEERGWREVEGDLNSLYAGKDLTEETLSGAADCSTLSRPPDSSKPP